MHPYLTHGEGVPEPQNRIVRKGGGSSKKRDPYLPAKSETHILVDGNFADGRFTDMDNKKNKKKSKNA